MSKFVLSNHAIERIRQGDKNKLRTKLTTDKVLEHLAQGKVLSLENSVYLFSELDNETLYMPTVEVGKNKHLVKTIFPAKSRHTWPRFVSEFRTLGKSALSVTDKNLSLIHENMVMVVMLYIGGPDDKIKLLTPMFSWFVKDRDFLSMLKDISFHQSVVDFVNHWYISENQGNYDMNLVDISISYRRRDKKIYGTRFPLEIPYEIYGAVPPFIINN